MRVEENSQINLIPTSKIFNATRLLNGSVAIDKLSVRLGDGEAGHSFDREQLVAELSIVKVDEIQLTKKGNDSVYTLNIKIPIQDQGRVREIGLYYHLSKRDEQGTLVAYYRQMQAIDKNSLFLRLILPHLNESKAIVDEEAPDDEISEGNTLVADREQKALIEKVDGTEI